MDDAAILEAIDDGCVTIVLIAPLNEKGPASRGRTGW
jgi:hypothetical protein